MSYATLADLKSYVGISNTDDDTELQRALDAAVAWVDNVTNRTFTTSDPAADSTTQRTYKPGYGMRLSTVTVYLGVGDLLWIDDLVDIDSLDKQTSAGGSWSTVDSGDYELQPLNADADSEPFTHILFTTAQSVHRFRVTGWFGWPATPDAVKEATILQASFVYRRRDAPFGISQIPGLEGNTGMRVRSKGDPTAESLLMPYIRNRVLV